MKAYVYQAALLCEDDGNKVCAELTAAGKAPADPNDESSYDSDQFPKGPYPNGGGEADTPQHCDRCGIFLENPLTPDGDAYVREAIKPFVREGDETWEDFARSAEQAGSTPQGNGPTVAEWIRYYLAPGQ